MVSEAKSYMMLSNHNNNQFNSGAIFELVCTNFEHCKLYLSIYHLQSYRDLEVRTYYLYTVVPVLTRNALFPDSNHCILGVALHCTLKCTGVRRQLTLPIQSWASLNTL